MPDSLPVPLKCLRWEVTLLHVETMQSIPIRKHTSKENHIGWTQMTPGGLFNALSDEELRDVGKGKEAFGAAHPGVRLYPDPFFQSQHLAAAPNVKDLVVAFGYGGVARQTAEKLVDRVRSAIGAELNMIPADEVAGGLAAKSPLLLVGDSTCNTLSRSIMRRFQVGIFDAQFPGRGGWGITCHGDLEPGMSFRYVLSCDETTADDAVAAFIDGAVLAGDRQGLCWMHSVCPGARLTGRFPDFEGWLRNRIGELRSFDAVVKWEDSGYKQPYHEVFVAVLTLDCPDGVISNGRMIDLGVEALRYYQQLGDSRGLDLFRSMLRGFRDYFASAAPAIYPSDLDFRLGSLIDCWNWAKWHPAVTTAELSEVPILLLGAMRLVHDYFVHRWKYRHLDRRADPNRRGELDFRHNHQTFPALTLVQGWRYFRRWELEEAEVWREDSDYIFGVIRPESFKYSENANSYERYAPEHYLTWLEASGRPIPDQFRDSLARFARRQWLMRDNEFRIIDYGDTRPGNLERSRPLPIAPWLSPSNPLHYDVLELERNTGGLFTPEIPAATQTFTGRIMSDAENLPAASGCWDVMPIDPLFAREFKFTGEPNLQFDKVCLRNGWSEDALYIAVEGVGSGNGISHSHHEAAGILRLNCGGRIWMVSNGYGKQIGQKLAGQSFRERQIGPVDHNMLLIQRAADKTPLLPPVNALLVDRREGTVPILVTAVEGYGGCDWRRHVLVLGDRGVVIIDQLVAAEGGSLPEHVWLEWNLLGAIEPTDGGARIEQGGVVADYHHFGSGVCQWAVNGSAEWYATLAANVYPHASNPLRKAIVRPAAAAFGAGTSEIRLATGLWLDGTVKSAVWDPAGGRLGLELGFELAGTGGDTAPMEVSLGEFTVNLTA